MGKVIRGCSLWESKPRMAGPWPGSAAYETWLSLPAGEGGLKGKRTTAATENAAPEDPRFSPKSGLPAECFSVDSG